MVYGYARVSTKGQARNGNSLEEQTEKLKNAGCEVIFTDAFTGKVTDRPEFTKLKSVLKDGDTLVACKLDRISRSASSGMALVDELLNRGVKVNILNMGVLDNTPTGKLIRNIFFCFAEFEREMIVERTMEGKEIARQREGYREGRSKKVIPGIGEYFGKVDRGEITVEKACEELNISKGTWYKRRKAIA